jgi:hypothetical protein
VVLEVRVAAADRSGRSQRVFTHRRAPEVRVHDDAGGVDDGTQEPVLELLDATPRIGDHVVCRHGALRLVERHPLACGRDGVAGARDEQLVRKARERREHLVDTGQRAPWVHVASVIRCPCVARGELATRHVDWCRSARR